jgi:NADH dehydrogenase
MGQMAEVHVVTGAYGFSGKYIAQRLLDAGYEVKTLTNSPQRENPFGDQVRAMPYHFDEPAKLTESLAGATVLYNTYWVRFNHKQFKHADAVENTLRLFRAAKEAGVQRVVHISITNPSEDSPLEYFRGKAKLERGLMESGLSYAILRPAVLFGRGDILINNIAWLLRTQPVMAIFGDGKYKLQPIYVDDLAELAVEQGKSRENRILDAIGPETFSYRGLVQELGKIIGKQRPLLSIPPWMGYLGASFFGMLVGDVVLTWEEIQGLMGNLLCTESPPLGKTRLTDWVKENAKTVGIKYANELARRENRQVEYENL